MAYKTMKTELLYEIFRRWQSGYDNSAIERCTGLTRKTVRHYIAIFMAQGLKQDEQYDKAIISTALGEIIKTRNHRDLPVGSFESLQPYIAELSTLLKDPCQPVKAKTAFEIICVKYNLQISYSAFKRFSRKHFPRTERLQITRIELPAGQETQIDYGRVGYFTVDGKQHVVYAFCGILSSSRLPFIEFVFKQDSVSFCSSNKNMWNYFGGTTEVINLDNLKAGVITPSIYDPVLNKSYSELLEHYGVFADPSRVRKPTDKGKIERFIPTARELYRKLVILHPAASLAELNEKAKEWCRTEYGMRKHGTTKVEPFQVFEQEEKSKLKALPEEDFVIPLWKEAKVHPDQFIQFQKKCYGLPHEYCGLQVWVRKTDNIIRIFHDFKLIREYVVPKKYRTYDPNDFQDIPSKMMDGGYPKYLLSQAGKINDSAYAYIKQVLTPHAYLNSRRAQGLIEELKKYAFTDTFDEVVHKAMRLRVHDSAALKNMFESEKEQLRFDLEKIVSSELGKAMIRDSNYYLN